MTKPCLTIGHAWGQTVLAPDPCHPLGDVALAAAIAEKLNAHYPGHLWSVHVADSAGESANMGGYVVIRNLAVSEEHGYFLRIERFYDDPNLTWAMRAGGEILERARLRRGAWNGQEPGAVDGIVRKRVLS